MGCHDDLLQQAILEIAARVEGREVDLGLAARKDLCDETAGPGGPD